MQENEKGCVGMPMLKRTIWMIIAVFMVAGNSMAVEEAKYSVIIKDDEYELRKYEPHILAETIVDTSFEDAGNEAFNRLFKYISGNNKRKQEVAMTAPVGQALSSQEVQMTSPVSQERQDGKWAVSFMMPGSFTLETTPEPMDSSVKIRRVPARYVAAISYSGFWSEKNYSLNLEKLWSWIQERAYRPVGEPVWARYNPPFMPWFLRRNEILVPVEIHEQ
ncbi:MAG: heme-binding protein [Halieaceae bacterium]|jgi:effector-binding domain-containing protein|nr:heme-binding protein [Halieaceae bacterium]